MYIRSLKECPYTRTNRPDSSNSNEFELLVRDCAAVKYGQDFHLYGRSGENQHGIDIFSDDWTILIQCKAYSPTRKNYKQLKKDITECLQDASAYFQRDGRPIFEQFIVATPLNTDTRAQDIEWKKGIDSKEATAEEEKKDTNVEVNVWFWNDLAKTIEDYRIHNDGDRYADEFNETLFLHKDKPGCENVTLKNLFVPQKCCEWNGSKFGNSRDDLANRINRFCSSDDNKKLLIIEGDAGSGKSSLSAMLCHNARENSRKEYEITPGEKFPTDLLNGRPLLAVRLRDLEATGDLEQYLAKYILQYLLPTVEENDRKKVLERQFPCAVLLLDGFDELCVRRKEGLNHEEMIEKLCSWLPGGFKIILTSRPKCINVNEMRVSGFSMISIQHYSAEKRKAWLGKYRTLFAEDSGAVDEKVASYILSVTDDSISNLCDTPLMLYMIIGSKAHYELTQNYWALYHYVFSDALINTPYSGQWEPNSGPEHPVGPHSGELLYWITEEIAYKMYSANETQNNGSTFQTEDGQFLLTGEGVKKVIEALLGKEDEETPFKTAARRAGWRNCDRDTRIFDLQRLHALCCYWRSNAADGPVEFYHNNIRDFFLCEKIRRELNTLYQMNGTDEEKTTAIAKRMIVLFKYGELNDTVLLFFREYARYAADEQKKQQGASPTREQEQRDVFFLKEQSHHLLPTLYQKMLTEGSLFDGLEMKDHIRAIRSILRNTAVIYHGIYLSILTEKGKIRWWNDVDAVKRSGMMRYIFPSFVRDIGVRSDMSKVVLIEVNLSGADLSLAHLDGAHLNGANLIRAHLNGANLIGANLIGAHLVEAHLIRADLDEADLRVANLTGAHLDGAHLIRADLDVADLRAANLNKANLDGAHLFRADLDKADLRGANLTDADLRNATLPDGFKSDDQDEQIAHLKSLNIPGLKI